MKKILLTSFIIVLGCVSTYSQGTFKFGLSGGLNLSNISSDANTKMLTGFHAGLITEVKFPVKLGVEGALLYSIKGAKVEGVNSNLENVYIENKLSYIDVPFVLKVYSFKVLSFQIGPQFSYLLSANYDGNDIKSNLNSADISVVGGIGVDVSKLRASLRYTHGLTELSSGGGKNNVIQATIGFWIK